MLAGSTCCSPCWRTVRGAASGRPAERAALAPGAAHAAAPAPAAARALIRQAAASSSGAAAWAP
jgi:hypothetical protein